MNHTLPGPVVDQETAYLFVDLSNLWYGLRADAVRHGDPEWAVRIHAGNLRRILAAGRAVGEAILVANREIPAPVLDHFRACFEVELVEAGRITGAEQAGDELLQNAIYRALFHAPRPGTVVLATGDGAGWQDGRGFGATLRAARQRGFGVEVVSFEGQLNRRLRDLVERDGVVVTLDPYYDAIAFLEGLRPARVPSLLHRATALPKPWATADALAHVGRREVVAA
jgi:hypothetical protein